MILGTRWYKVLITVVIVVNFSVFFIVGYCERIKFPAINNTSKKKHNLPYNPIPRYNKSKILSHLNDENNDKVIVRSRRNYKIREGDFYSDCAINIDNTAPIINALSCSNNDYSSLPQLVNNNKFCFKPAILKGRAALCYGATMKGTIGCGSANVVPFYLVPTSLFNPADGMNLSGLTDKIYGELSFNKDPEANTSEIKLSDIYTSYEISIINSPIRIWDFSIFCYSFLRFPELTMITLSQNNISWPISFEESAAHCDNALPSLSTIYLNDNPLIHLPTNVFASLRNSDVSYLNLRNCSLEFLGTYFGKGPLTHLKKLKTLDLSNNKDLQDGDIALFLGPLVDSNLEHLYLEEMHFISFPYLTLQKISRSLVRLNLDGSTIFTPIKFPTMNNMTDLSLDGCKLQKLDDDALKGLTNLKSLNISSNMFKSIPRALRLSSLESLIFRNSRVDLYGNSEDLLLNAESFQNMDNLLTLDLSQNRIHRLAAGVFDGLTSLTSLNLDDTHLEYIDAFSFRNLKNLYELKISYNNLKTLNSDMLFGLQNIVTICLNCNQINFDSSTKNHPFSHLKSLENLDLAYNYITNLHKVVYNMKSIRYINLKYNQITTWNSPAFLNTNLTSLHLADNNINNITEAMVQDFTQKNVREVSLSENHLICNCYMLTLLANKTFSDIVNRFNGICNNNSTENCKIVRSTAKPQANVVKPQSNMHIMNYYVFPVFAAIFGIVFVVGLFIRYKRKITSDISKEGNQIEPAGYVRYFAYDIFVSYSAIDKDWTFTQLLPLLEETLGLQVCVHERDFNAGDLIENNIEACMHNSSKVLFLLSRAFLASKWCLFEFDVASCMSLREERDMIVILKKDSIPENIIPDNLYRQMHSRTYIQWKDDLDHIKAIFRKLFQERIDERSHAEYVIQNSEPKGTYA